MEENEQGNQDLEAPIEEEYALEQRVIPFMGDDLAAALTPNGGIYFNFTAMCNALGLNVRGQLQRVQRTKELAQGLRLIPLQTRGGRQAVNCLRVDKIGLWLAGIETVRVKSRFRDKIEAYHRELAPVAFQVFLNVAGMSATQVVPPDRPQLAILAKEIDELTAELAFLRDHMQSYLNTGELIAGFSLRLEQVVQLFEALAAGQHSLEERVGTIDQRTKRLTPAHQRDVKRFIDDMVAYTQHHSVPLTYQEIYRRVLNRFHVGSYKEVDDERYDELMGFLRGELRKVSGGRFPEQGNLF